MRDRLKQYLEVYVRELYKDFDAAHSESHYDEVMDRARMYTQSIYKKYNDYINVDIDMDMVMVAAAYHDIGLMIERKNHNIHSGEILRADKELVKHFNKKEIEEIAMAVEDHRSSLNGQPRNIYGMIISDADRSIDINNIVKRVIAYRQKSDNFCDKQVIIEDGYKHIKEKFGTGGRLKFWLDIDETKNIVSSMNRIADDADMCYRLLSAEYDRVMAEKNKNIR